MALRPRQGEGHEDVDGGVAEWVPAGAGVRVTVRVAYLEGGVLDGLTPRFDLGRGFDLLDPVGVLVADRAFGSLRCGFAIDDDNEVAHSFTASRSSCPSTCTGGLSTRIALARSPGSVVRQRASRQ